MNVVAPPQPTESSTRARIRRVLVAMVLLAGLAALAVGFWNWRQWSRPGNQRYQAGLDLMALRPPDTAGAEKEWLRGIQEDPDVPDCYRELGKLYALTARRQEAAVMYDKASRLAPDDGPLFLELAKVQRSLGDDVKELEAAKRAMVLLPNNPDAAEECGILQAKHGDRAAAIAALRHAHDLKPDDSQFLAELVNTEMDAVSFRDAEMDLNTYLNRHPDDPLACYLMAAVYDFKPHTPDNLQTALRYAQKALTLGLQDAHVYTLIGRYTLDTKGPQAAVAVFKEGDKLFPNSEALLQGLIRCYGRLGDKSSLERITARLQQVTARHDRIQHLKLLLGFHPSDSASALELARLEEQDGKEEQARRTYEAIARKDPDNPTVKKAADAFQERMRLKGTSDRMAGTSSGGTN